MSEWKQEGDERDFDDAGLAMVQASDRACGCLTWAAVAFVALYILSLAAFCCGQEKAGPPEPPKQPAKIELAPSTADAVGWVLGDVTTLPPDERPFYRYTLIPHWGNERWVGALNFTVNSAANHVETQHLGTVLANGWLVRYDLRELADDADELAKLITTWDSLAVQDPYFHVPDTNTQLKIAVIAPHLPQDQAVAAANLTLSPGIVYRADWLITKMLSTLRGGKYYEFRQVERKPEKGTALDVWLSKRGVFVSSTNKAGGEKRVAMLRSGVTGRPRRVDFFPALSFGIGSITRDVKEANVKADSHPLRNLLEFVDDGSEIIVSMPCGLLDYLLADGDGNIVDEAPPDLVSDRTVPEPHVTRLQPAISCISCHGIKGDEGWRVVKNDVDTILRGGRLNVFDDVSKTLNRQQVIAKLRGLYGTPIEHADGVLARARRDYSSAVYIASAGLKFEGDSIVAAMSQLVTAIVHHYEYDLVEPRTAAMELGFLIPPDAQGDVLDLALGPHNETEAIDPIDGLLRSGLSVNRTDWEAIFADMALKAEKRRNEIRSK